jgi:transcriptional regulator with XRE-family HTH domain
MSHHATHHGPSHVGSQLFALHNVASSAGLALDDGAMLCGELAVCDEVGPDAAPVCIAEQCGHCGLSTQDSGGLFEGLLLAGSGVSHAASLCDVETNGKGRDFQALRHIDCHALRSDMAKHLDPKHAIGARLAEARARVEKTQADVAAYLNKHGIDCDSYKTISAWENGRNNLSADALRLLATLYKTSADVLLGTVPLSEPAAKLGAMYDSVPKDRREEAFYACKWALERILHGAETSLLASPRR